MNPTPMDNPRPPDSLSRTLAAWRVVAPRHPRFRTEVWSRIEAAADTQPWVVFARRHAAAVGSALALAMVVGAATGHGWARARVAADNERLVSAYVGGLDARVLAAR